MRLLVATSNPGKMRELVALFADVPAAVPGNPAETQPAAPTGPGGMPTGGNVRVVQRQGDPAQMRAQMQEAMAQMAAQKQAVMQYMNQASGRIDGTGGPAPAGAGLWGGPN